MSGPHRSSVRLGRSRRLALYVVGCGVWTSGALWLLFHYLLVQQGEFGPKISTLEPWWLKLHGAFAFATLWIFGLLWGVHVTLGVALKSKAMVRRHPDRPSDLALRHRVPSLLRG